MTAAFVPMPELVIAVQLPSVGDGCQSCTKISRKGGFCHDTYPSMRHTRAPKYSRVMLAPCDSNSDCNARKRSNEERRRMMSASSSWGMSPPCLTAPRRVPLSAHHMIPASFITALKILSRSYTRRCTENLGSRTPMGSYSGCSGWTAACGSSDASPVSCASAAIARATQRGGVRGSFTESSAGSAVPRPRPGEHCAAPMYTVCQGLANV
mmetsp:Transcript_2249/g.7126  ORF Transcript_2249/g.7126 Transcript_2249/m.7126 type:complete len:210 (+) Transcript_2249:815-1444(+)